MGNNKGIKKAIENGKKIIKNEPRCLVIAKNGVNNSNDFARYMSALMSDLIEGSVSPQIGNAACNAGGKLLKVIELEHKYGTPQTKGGHKKLQLIAPIIERS